MTGTLIASTPKDSIHALAFQGIIVFTTYAQISDMLRRKFGDEYVLLFARPLDNHATGAIDWYTPVQGTPRPLHTLPESEREAAASRAKGMADEIMRYAEELSQSPDPLKVTRGQVLKLALSYPDDSFLYAVGEQPVFVGWGFGPGTPGVEPKVLSRLAIPKAAVAPEAAPASTPPPPGPSAPLAPMATRNFGWLWWLFPLLAALLLLAVLLTSFGSVPALSGTALFHGPALPFLEGRPDPKDRIAQLEEELAANDKLVQEHVAQCKPAAPSHPVAESPGEQLVIPPTAQDTSFLEGRWLCETGLYSKRTGEPVQFAFSFGKDGNGEGTVYEKNDQCQGASQAGIEQGKLRISLAAQQCRQQGNFYSPIQIICENVQGHATQCTGVNDDGSQWTANFRKIK